MAMTQRSARDLVTDITAATDEGEYDAAVRAAAWGIEAYPDAAVFHRLRGTALVALGANEEAKADLALALAVDPLDHEALVTLSRLEEAEGDLYTAAEHLLTAWEHDPANGLLRSDLTYRLARLYGSEGYLQYTRPALAALYARNAYPERAAREYAAALAEQPTRVDLRLASVLARWRLGSLAETIDGCVLLLEEQPQLARARWALADALARRGQGEQARDHAKHAALLDPDGAIARALIESNAEATIVDPDEMVRVSVDLPHVGPRVTELHPDEMPAPVPPMASTYVTSFGAADRTETVARTPDVDTVPASPMFGALPDAGEDTLSPPEALADAEDATLPAPASAPSFGAIPDAMPNTDTTPAYPTFGALPDEGEDTPLTPAFPQGFEDGTFIAPHVAKPVEDEVLASSPYPPDAPTIASFAAADTVVDTVASPSTQGMTDSDAPTVAAATVDAADAVVSDVAPTTSVADAAAMPPGRDTEPEPVIVVPTEAGTILAARPGDEPLLDATDALLKAMNTLEASVEPETSAVAYPMAALPPVPEPSVAALPEVPPSEVTSIQAAPQEATFVAASEPPHRAVPSFPAAPPESPAAVVWEGPDGQVASIPPAPPVSAFAGAPKLPAAEEASAPPASPTLAPAPFVPPAPPAPVAPPVAFTPPLPPPLPPPSPAARRPAALMDPWAAMQARLQAGDAAGAVTLGRAALTVAGKEQDQVRLLLPAMRALVDAAPGRPDTRRLLGDTYRRLGQVAQAQGQYQQALLTRVAGKR